MGCPSDAELLAFADGVGDPAARASIDTHLDGCPDCLAAIAALARAGTSRSEDADLAVPQVLGDGEPRYVLDHELARGGMGRIFAAHDRLLDRPVAIKLLRANDAELARRFLRERLITARLQHPAIVPIYDAGTLDGGEPFLAMRMVSGRTLDRAAAEAHSFEERLRLLPAVIGVADAIAYAHGEGVIHRDLKPQNVLVGSFGEVVVLDWGIARVDAKRAGSEAEGAAAAASPTASATETRAGEVLGTLAYMAPEQAAGGRVDERADVFGLGAILYQVLTGGIPNDDRTRVDSANTAAAQLASHLSRFAELPPELAAIVQRAMAPEPNERYASARELAEDLKRWQAGRMVQAHQYSPRELVRRWIRKHRTKLAVVAAAAAVAGVLGSVTFWRVLAERRAAETERDRAVQARATEENQRIAAEALLEFVLGELRDRLEKVGRLDALDGVARAVLAYQQRSPAPASAQAWLQRSSAASLAGDVSLATGEFATAERAFMRALVAANTAVLYRASSRVDVARCRAFAGLGDAYRGRSALAQARDAFTACVTLAAGNRDRDLVEHVIASKIGQARLSRMDGQLDRARTILDELLPIADAQLRHDGYASRAAVVMASLRTDRWELQFDAGNIPAASVEADALLALAEARLAASHGDIEALRQRGAARLARGTVAEMLDRHAEANEQYLAALADARAVASREPSNIEWQRGIGLATDRLAQFELTRGHHAAGLDWMRESIAIARRIAELEPANPEWQRDLANAELKIGDALIIAERVADARVPLARAIAIFERLASTDGTAVALQDLALAYGHLGTLEVVAHDRPAAATAVRRSIALFRTSLARGDTSTVRQDLAGALYLLAQVAPADAPAAIEESLAVLAPLRPRAGEDPELTQLLAAVDGLATKLRKPH